MHLNRAQVVSLMSLAMSLPVDAILEINPDPSGEMYVTATADSMVVLGGQEPLWQLHKQGGYDTIRAPFSVPLDSPEQI